MSTLLNTIDVNDYGIQNMAAEGGGGTEDLNTVLGVQDNLLSAQEIKLAQMVQALENKKSIDLTEATSDANATVGDIADGKTAYVNGVKLTGNMPVNDNNAKAKTDLVLKNAAGSCSAKLLVIELASPIDCTYAYSLDSNFFEEYRWLEVSPSFINIPSGFTSMNNFFKKCYSLKKINLFDTSNITNFSNMCDSCYVLEDIPVFNTSKATNMQNMFNFNPNKKVTNESLNNILQMCINATSYTGTKTLAYLGLNATQQATCQTLSNWDAFVAAGWSAN